MGLVSRFLTGIVLVVLAVVAGDGDLVRAGGLAAGDLDPTFGVGGVASAGLGGGRADGVALQEDGKVLASGRGQTGDLTVVRFNADGTLDDGFNDDGVFTTDEVRNGYDVAVDDDGKVLASGSGDQHIVRLNSDGTPDTSFDQDGISGTTFFNPDDPSETYEPDMERLIVAADGDVVVGGSIDYGPYFFTFARYRNDGELDDNFGDDGQVQTDFSPPGDGFDQFPRALAGYEGNRFVAAGYRDVDDDSHEDSVIAMYKADGTLDDSFGDDGKTTNEFFALYEEIMEVIPLTDGRILAIGYGEVELPGGGGVKSKVFIARYDADGTLDDGFGQNGVIIFEREDSYQVRAAARSPDGSIVVVGNVSGAQGTHGFVARFDGEGNPDPEFGDDGWTALDSAPGSSQLHDIAVDEFGDIFVAGVLVNGAPATAGIPAGTGGGLAVLKLKGTAEADGTPRVWGDVDCDGTVTTRDNQAELRFVLQQNPLSQTEPCPDVGSAVTVDDVARAWGDDDCDGTVTTRDNQAKLRFVLQQNPLGQTEPCPDVGAQVEEAGAP